MKYIHYMSLSGACRALFKLLLSLMYKLEAKTRKWRSTRLRIATEAYYTGQVTGQYDYK